MNTNIIVAQFKNGQKKAVTHPAWFIDHGMVLSIEGIELPMAFEAHFSNSRNSAAATRVIGHEGQVEIPDELFTSGAPIIYCWIYLHPAAWIGLTKYEITIPLQQRANVEPPEPTTEQVDIIDQAISALNDGVAEARAQAENASSSASSAANSASSAANSASSAANSASEASQSADRAEQAARDASGCA